MFSEVPHANGVYGLISLGRADSSPFVRCSILQPLKGLSKLPLSNSAFSKLVWPWNPLPFKHSVLLEHLASDTAVLALSPPRLVLHSQCRPHQLFPELSSSETGNCGLTAFVPRTALNLPAEQINDQRPPPRPSKVGECRQDTRELWWELSTLSQSIELRSLGHTIQDLCKRLSLSPSARP